MATVQPLEHTDSFIQRDYSAAAKRALARKPALFINNEWVASTHGATLVVEDPSTGREIGRIADASDADVDRAVAAARAAFDDGRWSNLPPKMRERTINKLADLLEAHTAEFAELEAIDNGKPVGMATMVDIPGAVDHLRYMAGWASKLGGELLEPQGIAARHGVQLRLARTRRRRGADRALELPAADGDAQNLAGARRRLHADPEARRADLADGAASGGPRGRGGLSAGRDQRDHRQRPHGRRRGW